MSEHPVTAYDAHSQDDRLLVKKVLSGDHAAFTTIVKNTEQLVGSIISKIVSDRQDINDIAQEVYLNAYKNLPTFRFESKLSTWIGRIAYNHSINHLRYKKSLPLEADELDLQQSVSIIIPTDSKQRVEIIHAAIKELDPVHQTLITLYHQEHLTYAEIHAITGLPEGTIKSYLFRARKALKDLLLNQYKKEDL
ncbi:MAG: sigma-70 family RNA polymerase sigma factor [Chitinophagaceae bacterium]